MNEKELSTRLRRGVGVNFLGIGAKALHPALFVLVTRAYGPEVFGVYLLAHTMIELLIGFTLSGVQDGVLLFASRHGHKKETRPRMYAAFADAVIVTGLLWLAIMGVYLYSGRAFLAFAFPQAGVVHAMDWMLPALPLVALPRFVAAATKSKMVMHYDALIAGVLEPSLIIALALPIRFVRSDVSGPAIAYFWGHVLLTIIALLIYTKGFKLAPVWRAAKRKVVDTEFLKFAIPQNLNLTLAYFMSGVGVLFLGATGASAYKLAVYGTGAEIVRNLKQIRLGFSQALAPAIARLHAESRMEELGRHLTRSTRIVLLAAVPATLLVVGFQEPLLKIFHESYATNTPFMDVLALGALSACVLGLAANVIAMTGHSGWNLWIGVGTGIAVIGLNVWLVPPYGVMGAAAATALATAGSIVVRNVVAHIMIGSKLDWLSLAPGLIATVAAIGVYYGLTLWLGRSMWELAQASLAGIGAFFLVWLVLGSVPGMLGKKPAPTAVAPSEDNP